MLRSSGTPVSGVMLTSSSQAVWPAMRWLRLSATIARSGSMKLWRLSRTSSSSSVVPVEICALPLAMVRSMPLPVASTSQRVGLRTSPPKLSRKRRRMLLTLSMSSAQS